MRKISKSVVLIVTLCLLTFGQAWAGGGQTRPQQQQPRVLNPNAPSYLQDTTPITFDWYVDASWYTRVRWGEDMTSQFIQDKTGVGLNILIPAGDEANRKNLMIATGDVPDFVSMGWWEPQAIQLENSGLVWSLNELAELYAPTFFDDIYPSVRNWYTREDGNIYALPNAIVAPESLEGEGAATPFDLARGQYHGFMVRKDMYEALGRPTMNTPETFIAALEAARRMFPEVNGQPLIPLGLSEFNEMGNLSITDQLARLVNVNNGIDGRFNDVRVDPELQRWLRTLRLANERGLMPVDVLVDKDQDIQNKIRQGRYFAIVYARNTVANTINAELWDQDPNSIYITVQGPQNSRLEQTKIPFGSVQGWLVTYISKRVADPLRAINFLQYLASDEGKLDFFLGVEGSTFRRQPDGTPYLVPEVAALRFTDEVAFSRRYGNMDAYFFQIDGGVTDRFLPEPEPWIAETLDWYKTAQPIDVMAYDINLGTDTPAGVAFNRSMLRWGQVLPRLILARTEAEYTQILNEFIAFDRPLRAVYEPEWNRLIQLNIERLGRRPSL